MLNKLRKCLKSEIKDNNIFDIVIYGSAVKGKDIPRDIDIAVIFRTGSLRERLQRAQEIKRKIKSEQKIDIKGILLEELFKSDFFARTGIFLEGISIFDGKKFANKIGLDASVIYIYNMKDKTHTEKVKFNYILSGRNTKGLLALLKGKHLAPGVVEMPVSASLEFESILERHKIKFSKTAILKQI